MGLYPTLCFAVVVVFFFFTLGHCSSIVEFFLFFFFFFILPVLLLTKWVCTLHFVLLFCFCFLYIRSLFLHSWNLAIFFLQIITVDEKELYYTLCFAAVGFFNIRLLFLHSLSKFMLFSHCYEKVRRFIKF